MTSDKDMGLQWCQWTPKQWRSESGRWVIKGRRDRSGFTQYTLLDRGTFVWNGPTLELAKAKAEELHAKES